MIIGKTTRVIVATSQFLQARWRFRHLRDASLAEFQDRRAQAIIAYTSRNAAFYRAHWAGHDLKHWQTLPPVDKQLMMEHFSAFNTCGICYEEAMRIALLAEHSRDFRPQLRGFTIGLSSGTSGHRGLFVVSSAEEAAWATTMLARTLHHWQRGAHRVALFLRSNSHLYERIGGHFIQFRYFDLQQPMEQAIARLNAYRPTILVGPPSLLDLLATAQRAGSLHIVPQRLIAVAEVLEPQDQDRLENAFGVPVHQIYQCTEGLLAISCSEGRLHIQEDIVSLQTDPVPGTNGTHVTPIITDLWRTVQPIIRYRLNDILVLDPRPCPCGSAFRVIHTIEGRSDDLCYFPSADGATRPVFPDLIRRMLLLASDQILDYQAVQERCGHLRLYLTAASPADFHGLTHLVRQSVDQTLAQYGCQASQLEFEYGIPDLASGKKRRRVQRMIV